MTQTTCPTCGQELPTDADTFGSRLEHARVQLEMTRGDLAEHLGYQRTSVITRWETGQLAPTDIIVVEDVAKAVGVTPAWLLYGVREPQLSLDVAPEPTEPPVEHVEEEEVEEYSEWPDDITDAELADERPSILKRANEST